MKLLSNNSWVKCSLFVNVLRRQLSLQHDCQRRRVIKDITELSASPFIPEIKLHLITPRCKLWDCQPELCPIPDPYWAFFWPGGQALTRYILDNPSICRGKRILDIGSGCGSSVIAAQKTGASLIIANDVDEVALSAIKMNLEINLIDLEEQEEGSFNHLVLLKDDILPLTWTNECNGDVLITLPYVIEKLLPIHTVLVGDMFYDKEILSRIFDLLKAIRSLYPETQILIGDPGRPYLENHPIEKCLQVVKEYQLPEDCIRENYGFSTTSVLEFFL